MNWEVNTVTLWHRTRMYTFSINRGKTQKSRPRKGEVNQVPYRGPQRNIRRHRAKFSTLHQGFVHS